MTVSEFFKNNDCPDWDQVKQIINNTGTLKSQCQVIWGQLQVNKNPETMSSYHWREVGAGWIEPHPPGRWGRPASSTWGRRWGCPAASQPAPHHHHRPSAGYYYWTAPSADDDADVAADQLSDPSADADDPPPAGWPAGPGWQTLRRRWRRPPGHPHRWGGRRGWVWREAIPVGWTRNDPALGLAGMTRDDPHPAPAGPDCPGRRDGADGPAGGERRGRRRGRLPRTACGSGAGGGLSPAGGWSPGEPGWQTRKKEPIKHT